jgi:hypothetical protein
MKKLLYTILLIPSIAFAKEDIECAKKPPDFQVHCNFKVNVTVTRVSLNGGECGDFEVYRNVPTGYHWIIPKTDSCHYVSGLTLYTKEGKIYKFAPL